MRLSTSRAATIAALLFSVAGCQLITGSYDVDSKADSGSGKGALGPMCTDVAACCSHLTAAQATQCSADVELKNEEVCAAFLEDTMCSSTTPKDGGSPQTDGSTPQTDSMGPGPDVQPGKDVFVAPDTSHEDVSTTDPLDGTWTLTGAQCQGGETLSVNGTVTLTFSGASVRQLDTLTDGCLITETLNPATVTSSDITAPDGSVSCGVECTADDCTGGDTGSVEEPYTLSGGTLTITLGDTTGTCSSGYIEFFWTE
jgi:hypothetical protein